MEETRLGIPLLFNVDAVHGHAYITGATVFPNGLGAAATWDPEGVEKAASVTASEVRATGAHQNYSPTTDVARDPRWGRAFETFGESPHLVGELVAAKVRGYQGSGVGDPEGVVATAKHFPAYSEPERGEDAAPVDVSEYKLRNTFVAPFERALSEDVRSVMPSYNSINGEPSHGSVSLLRSLLRDELGFDGHVVSDWDGIRHLFEDHGTAHNHASAVKQARQAGLDIASVGHIEHADRVIELVEDGDLTEDALDTSVRRVLRLKFELGLFEEPFVDEEAVTETLGNDDHREVARQSARDSMTLLKTTTSSRCPATRTSSSAAQTPTTWSTNSAAGASTTTTVFRETILEAISASTSGTVTHAQGRRSTRRWTSTMPSRRQPRPTWRFSHSAKGGTSTSSAPPSRLASKPASGRPEPDFGSQRHSVNSFSEYTKPTPGRRRARDRPPTRRRLDGRTRPRDPHGVLPGTEGGVAIAETLFGENDPSGRLPITIPSSTDALPRRSTIWSTRLRSATTNTPTRTIRCIRSATALATTFETDDLAVAYDTDADAVTVEVDVSNVGDRTGTETVQIYARQLQASRVRPNRSLVGFDRVTVEPDETVRATVELPMAAFEYHVPNVGTILEPGPYRIDIDDHSETVELPEDA